MYLEKLLKDILEQEPTSTNWPEATFADGWEDARNIFASLVRAAIKGQFQTNTEASIEAAKEIEL